MKKINNRTGRMLAVTMLALWPAVTQAQTITKVDSTVPANSDTNSTGGRIPTGTTNKGDDFAIYGESVIKDGDTYKLWYVGNDSANSRIFYATSTNGLDWVKYWNGTPGNSDGASSNGCIPLGTATTKGDGSNTHMPCVLKDGNTYKMWYGGYGGASATWRIYHATSPDGLVWTKKGNDAESNSDTTGTQGRIPLGATAGRGDFTQTGWPSVIKDGNLYRMWYQGSGGTPAAARIYSATSPDGLTWTKITNAIEAASDSTGTFGRIPLGATATHGDTNAVTTPCVIKHGMTYLMWYAGHTGNAYRIYHATSTDGLTWTKKNTLIPATSDSDTTDGRIARGSSTQGDDLHVLAPSVIDEGRTLRFWYRGDKYNSGGNTTRVYSATCVKAFPTIENTAVANAAADSITLAGNLVTTGQAPTTVRVYWGTNDAGLDLAGWANTNEFAGDAAEGSLSTNLTGLAADKGYFFRFFATNQYGYCMADPVGTFITGDVTVEATDADAAEANPDTGTFTISRPDSSTNVALTVNYTLGGTAANGVDYTLSASSTVTIPAGAASATVTVTPLRDMVYEGDESVILTLMPGAYPVGASSNATVTMADGNDMSQWSRGTRITFTGYTRPEALTNFPALVTFDISTPGFAYSQFLSGTNADLRFTDAQQSNELPYEVEKWDTNGTSFVWVQVPLLAATNTSIWAFWGRAGQLMPTYTTNGTTWETNYIGVWHMAQTNAQDSTRNRFNSSCVGSVTQISTGKVDGADDFDADTDYLQVTDNAKFTLSGPFTIGAWVQTDTLADWKCIIGTYDGNGFIFAIDASNILQVWMAGTFYSSGVGIPVGAWKHVAFTREGSVGRFYVDGLPVATTAAQAGNDGGTLQIGAGGVNWATQRFDGRIDEVRLTGVTRSSNWMWACWMNQASNANFSTLSPAWPTITNAPASDLNGANVTLNASLLSTGQAPTFVTAFWGTNDGGTVTGDWQYSNDFTGAQAPGLLSTNVTGVTAGQTYYVRFRATNVFGEVWSSPPATIAAGDITVTATDATASESGGDTGTFTFSRPDWSTNVALTISYTLGGTATNGVDYVSLSTNVVMAMGATNVTVTVTPMVDAAQETSETVILTLMPGGYLVGAESNATVTITDGTWCVATNGLDSNGGTGWDDALATVGNALARANVSGGLVLVSNGVYGVTSEIPVTNRVTVRGFNGDRGAVIARTAGTIRIFNVNHANAVLDSLSISNGSLPDADGYYGGNVLMTNGTIRNCTITKGQARVYGGGVFMVAGTITNSSLLGNVITYGNGGGLYMVNGTVAGCTVSNNSDQGWARSGGGIHMQNGLVTNCWIVANLSRGAQPYYGGSSAYGAGIRMAAGTVRDCLIERNRFIENANGVGGGGIMMDGGLVDRCIIRYNREEIAGSMGGAGAYVHGGRMVNCQVYGNYSAYHGGGIYADAGQVINCTVVSNTAPSGSGGGIYMTGSAVTNTIVYFNVALNTANDNLFKSAGTFTFSCSTPLLNAGADTNNIAADPGFLNLATSDYHLFPSSPCIDAGTNMPVVLVDYEGNARPSDGNGDGVAVVDMGAYEFLASAGPLQCDFQANTNLGLNSLNVTLTATVTGSNTNGLHYYWDYENDGVVDEEGTDKKVVTRLFGVGHYTVALTVSNEVPQGATRILADYITVVPDADAYVATNGIPAYPYDSWASATTNLQNAIDRIEAGLSVGATSRTVWVGVGTYLPGGELAITKAVSLISTGGPARTVVNANASSRCLSMENTDAVVQGLTFSNGQGVAVASGVYMTRGLLTNCIVNGCRNLRAVYATGGIVSDCQIVSNTVGHGGGLYISGSGVARNCTILGNRGSLYGIGAYVAGGVLRDSTIRNNASTYDSLGAVYISGGMVSNCLITGNALTAGFSMYGGGAYLAGGLLTHCLIVSNEVRQQSGGNARGGGISMVGGTVRNCIVRGNKAEFYGGGGYMNGGAWENNTVVGNLGAYGGGLYRDAGTVTNTIIYHNAATSSSSNINTTAGVGYSCAPELTSGTGNTPALPQFKSVGSSFGLTHVPGDYHLLASPCIDGGLVFPWMAGSCDFDGGKRVFGPTVDMGVYEVAPPGTVFKFR